MPIRILPKDEQTQSESKWISKKKPKSWITKKEIPAKKTNWIVKKQPKTNWITKKEAKEHDTTSARKWITKKKPVRSPHQGGGRTNLLEELGRVEGEPSNRNRRAEISRVHGELNRGYKKGGRAGYGIGSIVKGAKKIISKVMKPKGVFKPKAVPKGVTDRPTSWSPKGSYTKADDKKITSMLKKLGDEIKAQPLPPKLKETMKKLQKAYPHKKAAGGRIGLKHGGSTGAVMSGKKVGAQIK